MRRFELIAILCAFGIGCIGKRTSELDAGTHDAGADETADAGVHPDANLLNNGSACVANSECNSQRCAVPCSGFGECVPATCQTDSECAIAGSSVTYCCSSGACEPVLGGACGDRSGQQGTSCRSGSNSDCAPGLRCIDACVMSSAYCAASCSTTQDCEALDPLSGCWDTPRGDRRCVLDPEKPYLCAKEQECGSSSCQPYPSYDGERIIKVCMSPDGTKGLGESCRSAQDCRNGICTSGVCSAACEVDADCACSTTACTRDQVCLDHWFDLGSSSAAAKFCYPGTRCDSTSDCSGSETCSLYVERAGPTTVCRVPTIAQLGIGQACSSHTQCGSGVCESSMCRAVCTSNDHCGMSETCQTVTLSGTSIESTICL